MGKGRLRHRSSRGKSGAKVHSGGTAEAAATEAKLFMNGRSQAVRLPAAYRFAGDSVWVKKWHGAVILLPKDDPWRALLESLGQMSSDFLRDRWQVPGVDERPGLDSLFD